MSKYAQRVEPQCCPLGTCINASKTATASLEKTIRYIWTIDKTVANVPAAPLARGQCVTLVYTLNVTRTPSTDGLEAVMNGHVRVTNSGPVATRDLTIDDRIQVNFGLGWTSIAGTVITPGELAPGETRSFPVVIAFTPPLGGALRNAADVTITNFIGHPGIPTGPTVYAPITLPEPTVVTTDATATVTDEEACPAGFTCTPSSPGPFTVSGSETIAFTKEVCNVSVCDSTVQLRDVAILITSDTETRVTSPKAIATFTTPPCLPPPPPPTIRGLAQVSTPL